MKSTGVSAAFKQLQLGLHAAAVATTASTAPRHDAAVQQLGRKRLTSGKDGVHALLQLGLHAAAVATKGSIAPGHDAAVQKLGRKRTIIGKDGEFAQQVVHDD